MLTTQTTIGTSWVSTAGVCGLRCVLFLAPASSGFLMHLLTPRARPTLGCTTMVLAWEGPATADLGEGLGIGVAFADSNLALDRR